MLADRWGVSADEVACRYPCDGLVPDPAVQVWRGVTVDAPPAEVWPWVRQLRLAPYSYDRIDNLGRRSPQRRQDLPEPRVGQPFTTALGRPQGRVLAAEPGVHLTATIMGAVMSYVLVPAGTDRTRLLLKIVMSRGRWLAPLISAGDLVMARRQLLNLKALAERDARRQS